MSEWTKAQEADFQELIHRASRQSRECYERRSEEPPPPPRQAERGPEQPAGKPPPPRERAPAKSAPSVCPPVTVCAPPAPVRVAEPVCAPAPVRKAELPCIGRENSPPPQRAAQTDKGRGGKQANKQPPPGPQMRKTAPKGLAGIMEKLDSEGIMLAALLWILLEEKADTPIILAVAYILLV